jgi:hypothetical protein
MGAAENVDANFNGTNPGTNTPLPWRWVPGRGRIIRSLNLRKKPFNWPVATTPQTTSTYDQVQLSAEQLGGRYVDAYGNVWDDVSIKLLLLEWLLDGAPTNQTPKVMAQKIAQYIKNADQLRPWPSGFAGAFAGEPQQAYPPFPPA